MAIQSSKRRKILLWSLFTCLPISIGLKGIFFAREEDIASARDKALASKVPLLIEFKTYPNVPL